ncbi:hypothetical protein GN157_13290 [Flavobacterium rakeshii]|uniref:Uncharacterized protein n=1 Tax=Flavobacterium rakeshii TaxID=1038845 RepID=A0A6N8HG23_9FLAO|nr:hypothetical protein [Flavobacterium rakeshii]MUV04685.1 hypothetical protein [Flavobacterium rakeshii]
MKPTYIIGTIVVISIILYYFFRIRTSQLSYRFATLLKLFLESDNKIKIDIKERDFIILSRYSKRGDLNIYLLQSNNIISIEVEFITAKKHIKDYEWFFCSTENQTQIYGEIISYLNTKHQYYILNNKPLGKVNTDDHKMLLSDYNAENVFCNAFKAMKLFDKEEYISFRSRFEIIFFNNVLLYSSLSNNNYSSPIHKEDMFRLLILYLENHELLDQVDNLEDFLEKRFDLYSEQAQMLNIKTDYDFSLLYNSFFLNPLEPQAKFNSKSMVKNNFSHLMLNMISGLSACITSFL